jgi:protein LTV1
MVKKPFIDKKKSVTYSLVYRSTEDADAPPERTLMEAGRGDAAAGQPDVKVAAEAHQAATTRKYPPGHPLAWIEDQELQGEMTDERRRELVELGFPDDGYDYLRHVRTLGVGAGSLEGLQGKYQGDEAEQEAEKQAEQQALATAKKQAAELATRAETTTALLGGKGPAKMKETGPVGPAVFMKAAALQQPEADVAVFDAVGLTVLQPTDVDEEATEMMGGVTAFSRRKDAEELGAERWDIEELEELMRALEADDDLSILEEEEEAEDGEGAAGPSSSAAVSSRPLVDDLNKKAKAGVRVKGRVLGEGDLLDDFILTATQGPAGGVDDDDSGRQEEGDWSSVEEYSDDEDDNEDGLYAGVGSTNGKPPPRPGSIASTYWREERTDRKNLLGVIDERFEQLALEYDEDEIGSMEDEADAGAIQGFADVSDFDNILNQFLEERKASRGGADLDVDQEYSEDGEEEDGGDDGIAPTAVTIDNGEQQEDGGKVPVKKPVQRRRRGESILKARLEAAGYDDADAEVAITAARAALRRMAEEEALGINNTVDVFELRGKEVDPTAGWDCESVLSLRSNLYNHPGTITEPGRSRKAPPSGLIRLNKDGIPMGVLPSKYAQRQQDDEEAIAAAAAAAEEKKKAAAAVTERKKGETAEEKRARKNAVKEMKRDARATKKELKTLYKEETVKAQRRAATAQVQPSVLL